MQNQTEQAERELKIRNYSPKAIKSYIYEIKEYFAFSKKDFENLNEKIKVRSAKKNKSLPVVLSKYLKIPWKNNEVQADIFSGSLTVFRNRKPTG